MTQQASRKWIYARKASSRPHENNKVLAAPQKEWLAMKAVLVLNKTHQDDSLPCCLSRSFESSPICKMWQAPQPYSCLDPTAINIGKPTTQHGPVIYSSLHTLGNLVSQSNAFSITHPLAGMSSLWMDTSGNLQDLHHEIKGQRGRSVARSLQTDLFRRVWNNLMQRCGTHIWHHAREEHAWIQHYSPSDSTYKNTQIKLSHAIPPCPSSSKQ